MALTRMTMASLWHCHSMTMAARGIATVDHGTTMDDHGTAMDDHGTATYGHGIAKDDHDLTMA